MSRKFPQALFVLSIAVLMASHLSASTYYIAANGSDSNNGTSESAPWEHLPGMPTWTGSHTPAAGDTFILRGCDDWGNSNFPVNWKWSGTSGSPITIDRDTTWYNTSNCPSGWNRPKFDAGSAVIDPPECTGTNAYWTFSAVSNVTVNWIELINYFWASANSQGSCAGNDFMVSTSSSASNVQWNNSYVHAWTHGGSSGDLNGSAFMNGCPTCSVNFLVMDNSDGSKYSGGGMQWPTQHSIFVYVANAIKPHMGGEYAYNNISHLGVGPGGNHPNCIETIGPIPSNASTFWIHDNWIHDMPLPEQCETLQVGNTGETDYVWNNVWCCDIGGGYVAQLPQNSQPDVTAFYMFNNVWEENLGNGVCANIQGSGSEWVNAFVMINNLCLVPNAPNGTTQSQLMMSGNTVTGATTIAFSNNIVETMATAKAHNCLATSTYPYMPTSSCQDTVGTGSNLTSKFMPAGFSTIDTSYACSEQTVSGVVESVCPQRTANTRPSSGAWDSGAYEFESASSGQPNPPTGLTVSVQ